MSGLRYSANAAAGFKAQWGNMRPGSPARGQDAVALALLSSREAGTRSLDSKATMADFWGEVLGSRSPGPALEMPHHTPFGWQACPLTSAHCHMPLPSTLPRAAEWGRAWGLCHLLQTWGRGHCQTVPINKHFASEEPGPAPPVPASRSLCQGCPVDTAPGMWELMVALRPSWPCPG